jgi:uncharacterized protein (TIGR03118 family)
MRISSSARSWRTLLLAGASLLAGTVLAAPAIAGSYAQANLVTDDQAALAAAGYAPAAHVDPNLINPWGIDHSPTGAWFVANTGSATVTTYKGSGASAGLTIATPQANFVGPAGPTGIVYNAGGGFALPTGGASQFLVSNLDGSISGWNAAQGSTAVQMVAGRAGGNLQLYTGLATGDVGGQSYLYAPNGITGNIDVFDQNFARATLAGGFVDPGANPNGLTPFNVQNLDGHIWITYAIPGPTADEAPLGVGFVSEFNTDGTFIRRFADGGSLASPWGIAIAPSGFGAFSGDVLIGNFVDSNFGYIGAYRESDGAFQGLLSDANGNPIANPGLWGLEFGNDGAAGPANELFFAAGIGDEAHGLFGGVTAVPEPASWALMILGFGFVGAQLRAKRRRTLFAA